VAANDIRDNPVTAQSIDYIGRVLAESSKSLLALADFLVGTRIVYRDANLRRDSLKQIQIEPVKIDQLPMQGSLMNMKFLPSSLKTEEDLKKLVSLIKTYLIALGGKHIQFNVVDHSTQGNSIQRKRIARTGFSVWACQHAIVDREAYWRQNVTLFPIAIAEQSDPCRPIGIVLDGRHLGRNAQLLAPEVDAAEQPLVPAAPVAHRQTSSVCAATLLAQTNGQRFQWSGIRKLVECLHRQKPP
jgi:hypothetical protein